jgi:DNA repair exonuclease SbcCD ATPase subunit
MKVTHVRIKNILGVEQMEITPGKFTEIRGRNAAGKTSVLEAIKAALKGGHDATLLRNGADEGEIVLLLDNGDEVRKVVTADKSELKVRHDGKLVRNGVSILDTLRDIVSVNPVEFIQAVPKRRLEILLEAMPIEVTDEEVSTAAGFQCRITGNPLDAIGTIRKQVYDERTGLNRAEREKRATLNQLAETMPTIPEVMGSERANIMAAIEEINTKAVGRLQAIEETKAARLHEIDAQLQALQIQRAQVISDAQVKAAEFKAEVERETSPLREKLRHFARIDEDRGRYEQQKAIIEQMEREVEELKVKAEAQTSSIERLDALKDRLLEKLPFSGLTIQQGDIYLNGVPFDRVNSSDQVRFVLQLAKLRAGDLKLVCVDGLEMIDPERYTRFVDVAKQMDLQFIVTRVTNEELTVESAEA